jgi:hypothetical protein
LVAKHYGKGRETLTDDGIADYQGLRRFLLRLGPPPPDHIRVFRGQTRDFGRMLPSGLRGTPLRSETIFRAYTALLASDVMSPKGDEGRVDAETYVVWTRAIAQHYGPGSHYLDVTTSVDVALWFALHEVRTVVSRHCFGPPGPMDARTDTYADADVVVFDRVDTGCLFVLDVPIATAETRFDHGALLDLSEAPAIFSSSPRIRAQEACLVHADARLADPDLASLYACPPVRVTRPMQDCPLVDEPFARIFPSVDDDPWYAKFVGIPWCNRLDPMDRSLAVRPPIPMSLYVERASSDQALLDRLIVTPPLNVHRCALEEIAWCSDPPHEILQSHPLADAVRIVLEAPVFAMTPTVPSEMWNEGLLSVQSAAGASSPGPGEPSDTLDITNVFLEFSPLEHTGWEAVERGRPLDALRGVWLVRDGSAFVMSYFFQELPAPGSITGAGGFEFRYDEVARRFRLRGTADSWIREAGQVVLKRLFTTLFVLRCCSPGAQLNPFPVMSTQRTSGASTYVVNWFQGPQVTLMRATSALDNSVCYVPRMRGTQAEFYSPNRPDGLVVIENVSTSFADVDPNELRVERGGAEPLPP